MQTDSSNAIQHPAIDALRGQFPDIDFAPAALMARPEGWIGPPSAGARILSRTSSTDDSAGSANARIPSRTSSADDSAGARIPSRTSSADDVQRFVRVLPDRLLDVMRFLYSDPRCKFEQLCDLTCIDYLNFPKATDRYGVIYSLLSLSLGHRLWLKCFVNDPAPEVPSVTSIWKGAEWLEREVWDLFGVKFTGHPDLRRIMTWEGFEAHPLRKDYPLTGQGERENFQKVTRESA